MDIDRVLQLAEKNFNFRLNNQLIIKALYNKGQMTADEICDETGVPRGRVYEYLNELVEKNLIVKTSKQPFRYYIDSMEQRAVEYSANSLMRALKKQENLIKKLKVKDSLIPLSNLSDKIILRSREEYNAEKLGFILRDKLYHSFFFPFNDLDEYFSFKQKFEKGVIPRSYSMEARRDLSLSLMVAKHTFEQKIPVKSVMGKSSIDFYFRRVKRVFGKEELAKRLQFILDILDENKQFKIRVVDEYFSYSLSLTDKSLVFTIVEEMNEDFFMNGFLLRNEKDVKKYWNILQTRFDKGIDLKKVVKSRLDEL